MGAPFWKSTSIKIIVASSLTVSKKMSGSKNKNSTLTNSGNRKIFEGNTCGVVQRAHRAIIVSWSIVTFILRPQLRPSRFPRHSLKSKSNTSFSCPRTISYSASELRCYVHFARPFQLFIVIFCFHKNEYNNFTTYMLAVLHHLCYKNMSMLLGRGASKQF